MAPNYRGRLRPPGERPITRRDTRIDRGSALIRSPSAITDRIRTWRHFTHGASTAIRSVTQKTLGDEHDQFANPLQASRKTGTRILARCHVMPTAHSSSPSTRIGLSFSIEVLRWARFCALGEGGFANHVLIMAEERGLREIPGRRCQAVPSGAQMVTKPLSIGEGPSELILAWPYNSRSVCDGAVRMATWRSAGPQSPVDGDV
jgi:hypothetical protein